MFAKKATKTNSKWCGVVFVLCKRVIANDEKPSLLSLFLAFERGEDLLVVRLGCASIQERVAQN